MKPVIIKHEPLLNKSYGFNSRGNYTPYYMKKGNTEQFICNLVERTMFAPKQDKGQRTEVAERLLNLRKNKFKFIAFYCGAADNPKDFLKFVKENNYTLQIHGEIFRNCDDLGFTDFHGNLIQVSCSFMFRIYDKKLLKELQEIVKTIKVKSHR